MSDEIQWSQDMMLEVTLKEPDDFLKVRETLTRMCCVKERAQTVSVLSHSPQTW